jgi:putative selenate reductase
MTPIPFDKLIRWMIREYKDKSSVFGVKKEQFYKNASKKKTRIFGQDLGSPIGAAAGPNTQLAQNLVAGYLGGLRFMELKTVQVMDGEQMRKSIARPCINMADEGYNCEWSTELTVKEAFEEYVKGWFALHVAAREFGISKQPDFIFNMSVGYDYDGITSAKIDGFINGMTNAKKTGIFSACKAFLLDNLHLFEHIDEAYVRGIESRISASITLSTLHGCPPEEIERIARHFITVKKLHTYIKLNPTLLGYETARGLLDEMGYGYVAFDRRHFEADLKFADAVVMIERLKKEADGKGFLFGVKLTNTFPVMIKKGELPGEFMYMSGKALFPLSIHVAKRINQAFRGMMPISFSGGADYYNVDALIRTGIAPVTVATSLLKPGGYARAKQMCEKVEALADGPFKGIDTGALDRLADDVVRDVHYRKRAGGGRKLLSALPLYDCFVAPCANTCPIGQQIPEYLALAAAGEYEKAFSVIAVDNPLPAITSEICSHACQEKCTRTDYDEPVAVRSAKNAVVKNAQKKYLKHLTPPPLLTDKKAAVIGAGPAGMAAALYLRRNGVPVTVFEKRAEPMGVVRYLIPEFRISEEALKMDFALAEKTGVEFVFGADENYDIQSLKDKYDFVVIATGAWKEGVCPLQEGKEHLLDAIAFLEASRGCGCKTDLGETVAVIGGGDVAMDCARAAKRSPGTRKVSIVYRRTREFMPAQAEEIDLVLRDGIEFLELLAPVSYDGKTLVARKMRLGEAGADGRRKPVPTDETLRLSFDTVISAVGARVDKEAFTRSGIATGDGGYAALDESNQSSLNGVYVAGDCRLGAATIVQAAADSKKIAIAVLKRLGLENDFVRVSAPIDEKKIAARRGVLAEGHCGPDRCLGCLQACGICAEVCPNRANISIIADEKPQMLHVDGMCNECGNCATFCPHIGKPYRDKVTLFWSREALYDSENKGFVFLADGKLLVRSESGATFEAEEDDRRISNEMRGMIRAVREDYGYLLDEEK